MRLRTLFFPLLVGGTIFAASLSSFAQEERAEKAEKPETERRVVSRVTPSYPDIARSMHLSGVVKVEAVVASNGTVKSVAIKGGHPVLVQAAANAVSKWKWAPASHETKEPIEVRFNPD